MSDQSLLEDLGVSDATRSTVSASQAPGVMHFGSLPLRHGYGKASCRCVENALS